jgi:predicted dinucleotide-binding enzyme
MDPTSLAGQLAQGKAPTSKSSRPSQHSSKNIVTSKKAKISVARLIACLTMIIIASTPFHKLMSSMKTLMAKGEVLISKGGILRGATLEDYQKPKCQK